MGRTVRTPLVTNQLGWGLGRRDEGDGREGLGEGLCTSELFAIRSGEAKFGAPAVDLCSLVVLFERWS